jgi:nucleotide-binding universal stress UspA family protein
VAVETRLVSGYPIETILDSVRAAGAELVAVGTHGPTLIERLLVGSVASGVLHDARVAVLAAPPPEPDVAGLDARKLDAHG